jgi:uncharacterized protein YjbJ (UPF0337 family)
MGILDKLLGRSKQAAGDVVGDSSLRREGVHQEQKAAAEERADSYEEMATEARADAARHDAAEDES